MNICEDCIHYDICPDERINAIQQSGFEFCCEDRSKFIKLPCAVGDDVWIINEYDETVIGGFIYYIEIRSNEIRFIVSFYSNKLTDYFTIKDINKTVFFTKAMADMKLEEIKQ